ncbi:uncharacterized protein LOC115888732 isoform X3 [Sitophilus oryzae]|uniref:Uncharacterized protein LOC115888732 isoform X3 n=1 Tax=Sitophilus oryzae TaxID=7048 RepID=A0A6J2YM11_SITOR|nr:uncharacterized protein LOC115888732 isoform X3 [Sitophilus oryzae]
MGFISDQRLAEVNDSNCVSDNSILSNKLLQFMQEVYKAISLRLGDIQNIPKDHVKTLFNDMQLFPSDNEVTTMLQCVRQCRNGSNTTYLTFGEFCFLVREMQNKPKLHKKFMQQQKVNNNKCPKNKCEVFLGGSCNPTTWRADTAIPELEKHGISFYNPQVSMWAPELLAQEHDAKQSASVLLFVIDSQTRSTVGMLEVAYLVASGRCVIVVAQPYKKGQTIMGETITDREYCDLVKGQKSLLDLIKSKGVQIHNNLTTALQCTADILRNVSVSGSSPEEQIVHKIRRLREVYDSYNGQMQLYDIIDAYSKLTNRSLEISKLYNYLNLQNSTENGVNSRPNGETNGTLSFEKFCALMAELSTDGCSMCNIEGRDYIRPLYWSCALLKTRYMVRNMVLQPISSALAWATQSFSRNNHQHGQCPNEKRSRCAVDQSQASVQSFANRERFYDVYLGGSLSTGNKWRENIAEPLLKKHGVEYYNPAIRDHENGESKNDTSHRDNTEEDTEWRHKIDRSKIVLFVIPNDTRSLTTMIVAAHYIGSGKDVVLSIEQLNCEGCMVADEPLTKNAIKDYNRARAYLRDVAERRHVPVFDSPDAAVNCVLSKLSITTTTTDLSTTENDRY